MNYNDNKENMNKNTASAAENEEKQEGAISPEAASALESGTFDEKDSVDKKNKKDDKADGKKDDKKEKKPKKKRSNPFGSRKFKKGSYAVIFTCIIIAAVIVVNIIANVLQAKVPVLSVDMSGQNLYELSESSKEVVDSVDKEVTISVMAKEDAYTQADENFLKANALLKKYTAQNDKIKIEYVDLQSNPTYINNYPNENISSYSYIVSCGDKYKYLEVNGVLFTVGYDYTSGESYVQSSNVESEVTSAIYFVTSESQTKAAVINGFSGDYNDGVVDSLTSLLKANNYEVEEVNLLTDDIPEDADIAILFEPTADLSEEATNRITDYLNNNGEYGKNFFYVPTYTKVSTPNIDSILEEWGMSLGQGIIAETDSSHQPFTGDYYASIFEYGGTEYTESIQDTTKSLLGYYTRPVIINDSSKVTSIAATSSSAALRSFDADDQWEPTEHIEGSFNVGAVSVRTGDSANSTVTVWGSGMSFYSQWLNSSTYVNGEYFMSLFNTLTDREDSVINIESKSVQSAQLGIMSDQISALGPLFMYIIPIIVLVIGLVIWIRRRHR